MPWQVDKYVEMAQSVVLNPDLAGATSLFFFSLINELTSILPLGVILASQLAFLEEPISVRLFSELFALVALPVGIGVAIGSLFFYTISYYGGKPAIDRFGKYVRVSWEDVEKMENHFTKSKYDELLFLLLRSTPFFPNVPVTIAAGIIRMNLFPFVVLTAGGTILRIMIMFALAAFGFAGLF